MYMDNTFCIFSGHMYRGVYNKARFVDPTVCATRVQSVSLAVNFHQTRRCNLVEQQSMWIDQKAFSLQPAFTRTPDLEKIMHDPLKFLLEYYI